LAKHSDRIVSSRELLSIAWADLTVEENNVRVQITALRRALGDPSGSRFIANIQGHSATVCFFLVWTTPLFIEFGDYGVAQAQIEWLQNVASRHSLKPYFAIGLAWKGWLTTRLGDCVSSSRIVEDGIDRLRHDRYDVLVPRILSLSAEFLCLIGELPAASERIDKAILEAKRLGDVNHMADILRIKGDILARSSLGNKDSAAEQYLAALGLAQQQEALIWQVRAMASLVRLGGRWAEPSRIQSLRELYDSFEEGFDSRDLVVVRSLLETHR
jgi:hypothetical protein